jgi:hypothetical protein
LGRLVQQVSASCASYFIASFQLSLIAEIHPRFPQTLLPTHYSKYVFGPMLCILNESTLLTSIEQVVKGDMSDSGAIGAAVAKSRAVISLLGPSATRLPRNAFADYYRTITPLMKQHGVHRILVLGTTAIYQPDDRSSLIRAASAKLIKVVANSGFQNILAIQEYFEHLDDPSIEWTIFRLGFLSGTSEASAWLADREREKGNAFAGPVGAPGFTFGINRSVLARWLVDVATSDYPKWKCQMPAVSTLGKV